MNKRLFATLFFVLGLYSASAFAQAPRLTNIVFTKNGIPTTQVGYGFVTVELVFDKPMDQNVAPVINYSLDQNYGLTFPAQGSWQDTTTWQGQVSVTDIVPLTADGEYLFRISSAQDTSGTAMNQTFSIDINNTTLFICRTGKASLSADSLKFDSTPQGVAKDRRLVVHNSSCADLRVTNFSISSPFSLISLSLPKTISANDSLVLTVRFLPTQRAQFVDSLMLRTNDRKQADHYVFLSGTSVGPNIVTSPVDTLDFGKVRLDSSATRTVKIHNREAADSTLSDTLRVTQLSTNNNVFKASKSSLTVVPGDTASFTVTFTPQQAIKYKGFSLTLVHNDSAKTPYSIYLKGNAQDETPPAQVGSLQPTWSGRNGFTRTDSLLICWDNPNDPSGIASVLWKFVTSAIPPATANDTTNGGSAVPVLQNGRNCVYLPLRGRLTSGRWYCYVWLVDGRGNSGYRNAVQTVFTYDVNPPDRPTLISQSIAGATWFGRNSLYNITIAIPPDQQRGFPDASEIRWKFKSPPDSASDFIARATFNALQTNSATVSIPFSSTSLCGDDSVYFWLADSAGNSNHLNYSLARYRFDICPPNITRTGSSAPAAELGKAFRETVVITDDVKIDTLWFEYRFGGAETAEPPRQLTRQSATDTFYVDIPQPGVTRRGIEYHVIARDSLGNQGNGPTNGLECSTGSEKWYPIATRIMGDGDFRIDENGRSVPLVAGTDSTTFQLFSVPYALDSSSVLNVLGDDLGVYDDTQWRLFDYNTASSQWLEGASARSFAPGRSFFIITRKENIIIDSGSGQTVKTVCPDSIELFEGWNLIAVPFNFPVNKDKLSLVNTSQNQVTLRSYERGWNIVDIMEPWRGYALYVTRATGVSSSAKLWLVVQPNAASGRNTKVAATENRLAAEEWLIRISAQAGKVDDKDNWLGVRTFALNGFDALELAEPPVLGKYIAVSFPHDEWNQPAKHFSTDYRSAGTTEQIWAFEVETNQRHTTVNLSFDFLGELPAGAEVFLIDEDAGVAQNLKARSTYAFRSGKTGARKNLKVVVGNRQFAQEQAGEIALVPEAFELLQNYPNPFNPETNIRYNLPQAAKVKIVIYDQLGRQVRTLVNGEQQNAGYYERLWNGRDDAGKQAASGLYIYKITAGGQALSRKMVLLK